MIVPMKRLTLIALKKDEERIMHALQRLAAIELISSAEARPTDGTLEKLEENVQHLHSSIALLSCYSEKPRMGPKPEFEEGELAGCLPTSLELSESAERLERELASARAEIDKRCALIESLSPWEGLNSRIEQLQPTNNVRFIYGLLEQADLDKLSFSDAAIEVFGETHRKAMLIACHAEDYEAYLRELKGLSFSEYEFPKLIGTPLENIKRLESEITDIKSSEKRIISSLNDCASELTQLRHAFDAAIIARDREAAKARLSATSTSFILEGWMRSDEKDKVFSAISAITDVFYFEERDPLDDEEPPSVVKNNKLIKPFETVTNLYSRPSPSGIDGTPYMTPFYFLFFGMMLSDTGYGLVLFLGCLLFLKFMKPSGMTEGIAKVLCLGGISTIICGFFIGTFFGMDWNDVFGTPAGTWPILFDPMNQPMPMLYLCFGLGLFHMLSGVCINIWRTLKSRDYAAALFDNFSWLMIVLGLLVFGSPSLIEGVPPALAKAGLAAAALGGVLVLVFAGRDKKNILKRAISGAGKLYDISGYLSDMLSYARVFALALSTGVIASVMNMLVGMIGASLGGTVIGKIIGFIIMAALLTFLHAFSIGINVLGCFVHCARLQYVEFYGRFYDAGGRQFIPLGYYPRFVKVK